MGSRMRQNRGQTGKRRSHQALTAPRLSQCRCGASHARHQMCPSCGKYRNRLVVDVVSRIGKKVEKQKAKAAALGAGVDQTKKSKDVKEEEEKPLSAGELSKK